MQVRLLGPVDVTGDGGTRSLNGLRRKAVLAVLALRNGEIVSTDRLVDLVWGDDAPPTAVNTLQCHVSHLRGVLGRRAAIVSRPPGYLLDLGTGSVDAEVAEELVDQARRSADHAQRRRQLQAALELWRGRSLADVTGLAWLEEQSERLEHLRWQADQALIDSRLALGEHAALLPRLERLAGDHPFDEQVCRQLMVALYRSGRQADALAACARLRRDLDEQLGVAPGRPLRLLETAILRQDPDLEAAAEPRPAGPVLVTASRPVPAQLPADVRAFTGRERELSVLDRMIDQPATWVVAGTAGSGKTALAVRWAHRAKAHFPDGQLYVDLRGYDPDQPMRPGDVLTGFLHALGVADRDIPCDVDVRAAAYRTLMDGRRALLVLDNAACVAQVRPLLPGAATCRTIVTSRDTLAGLVAQHGARRLELDVLPAGDAVALLRALIGRRADAEPAALANLAAHCARLPFALRAAAERAVSCLSPLFVVAADLSDLSSRLDRLDADGDAWSTITSVFSWSVRGLPDGAGQVFAWLGRHPGPDFDPRTVAALAGTTVDQAGAALHTLARAHLVYPTGTGCYAMHDLLRAYAAQHDVTADGRAPAPPGQPRVLAVLGGSGRLGRAARVA